MDKDRCFKCQSQYRPEHVAGGISGTPRLHQILNARRVARIFLKENEDRPLFGPEA